MGVTVSVNPSRSLSLLSLDIGVSRACAVKMFAFRLSVAGSVWVWTSGYMYYLQFGMGRSDVACWSFGCARLAGGSPARRTRAPMSALEVSTTLDPPLELTDVTRDSRDETREDRAREAELRCE